jgi:hypothetical protein
MSSSVNGGQVDVGVRVLGGAEAQRELKAVAGEARNVGNAAQGANAAAGAAAGRNAAGAVMARNAGNATQGMAAAATQMKAVDDKARAMGAVMAGLAGAGGPMASLTMQLVAFGPKAAAGGVALGALTLAVSALVNNAINLYKAAGEVQKAQGQAGVQKTGMLANVWEAFSDAYNPWDKRLGTKSDYEGLPETPEQKTKREEETADKVRAATADRFAEQTRQVSVEETVKRQIEAMPLWQIQKLTLQDYQGLLRQEEVRRFDVDPQNIADQERRASEKVERERQKDLDQRAEAKAMEADAFARAKLSSRELGRIERWNTREGRRIDREEKRMDARAEKAQEKVDHGDRLTKREQAALDWKNLRDVKNLDGKVNPMNETEILLRDIKNRIARMAALAANG